MATTVPPSHAAKSETPRGRNRRGALSVQCRVQECSDGLGSLGMHIRMDEEVQRSLIETLRPVISVGRLGTYLVAAGFDPSRALQLYIWNARVGEAFHLPIQAVEVGLRNRINDALLEVSSASQTAFGLTPSALAAARWLPCSFTASMYLIWVSVTHRGYSLSSGGMKDRAITHPPDDATTGGKGASAPASGRRSSGPLNPGARRTRRAQRLWRHRWRLDRQASGYPAGPAGGKVGERPAAGSGLPQMAGALLHTR